jgi:hypothetical protein
MWNSHLPSEIGAMVEFPVGNPCDSWMVRVKARGSDSWQIRARRESDPLGVMRPRGELTRRGDRFVLVPWIGDEMAGAEWRPLLDEYFDTTF